MIPAKRGKKDQYYETLEQNSQHWYGGTHDPWPYISYILFILKSGCTEFEERAARLGSPKGEKAEMGAIRAQLGAVPLADIERACPRGGYGNY